MSALPRVKAVIIGAGAGGPIVAKELTQAGWPVVLLERGQWYTANDCRKDDLRNQRNSTLGHPFGPDDDGNPRVVVTANGQQRLVEPSGPGYSNNAACVGGGTLSYGAMAWRFHPNDFQMKTVYGAQVPRAVEGSTLADWPITYDELEPFYEKAEWELGVSGDVSTDPFHGPRNKPLPMPPLPPTREHLILEKGAKALGLHPFHIPMLRNSVPYNGRPACMRCRWCVGFACEVDAKCGTQNTVLPTALNTGLLELRLQCMVKEILVDEHGKATGVAYFDRQGQLWEQPAEHVIVSGSAIESARLLLNSKSRLFPQGLGNRYDWVGRNLQGHTYTGAFGLFDQDTYDDVGPGAGIAICDYNHGNPDLAGGAMLANEFIRLPYQFVSGLRAPGVPRWGAAHKEFVRRFYRRSIAVQGPTQEMPFFESRVTVDPQVRDKLGIPVARLSGNKHPHTIEIGDAMTAKAEAWLKASGAIQTWPKKAGQGTSGGQHQAGTCRMGNDPRTSVVDRWCRLHEVENVHVVDGSVHVTNGGFNPVLTIMANAYRVAGHLVGGAK
ncbi:GMC family oxidoreductase [Paludibaculum fermentans]|uniref:GMC family oxidoreductase n=1 Tax=Paludibaculum fermentans TaxID=1473598 RepID=UPI001E3519FD|nr:GMC family oxidoreductase [Paludibaculum fermentans]